MLVSYGDKFLSPHPTPRLEDYPLSAVHDCLFTATLHIWRPSGAHITWLLHLDVTHLAMWVSPECGKTGSTNMAASFSESFHILFLFTNLVLIPLISIFSIQTAKIRITFIKRSLQTMLILVHNHVYRTEKTILSKIFMLSKL